MQLSKIPTKSVWYFVFGGPQKSSLAQQFASEHKIQHIKIQKADEFAFKDSANIRLVIECPSTVFSEIQPLNPQIQVVFLPGELTVEEIRIRKDYQKIGRSVILKSFEYRTFRKAVYPKLVILYGPCPIQKRFLVENYFNYTGYFLLHEPLTAHDMVTRLPKESNYVLLGFVPTASELLVIEEYFDVQIIHLKHQRTELNNQEAFFNNESKIIPDLAKKSYCYSIPTSTTDLDLAQHIGCALLPELIFVNASEDDEKKGALDFIENNDELCLDANEITQILKRKGLPALEGVALMSLLVNIIWSSADRERIFLTGYPTRYEEFAMIKDKTRSISLFADCCKPQKYEPSIQMNAPIFFLEAHKRKQFHLDVSFDKQLRSHTKYIIIAGPSCVGKTCAAKYISSNYGYKHIEYEPYIASVKEKLMGSEEGEEVPFPKIIKHFTSLIQQSGSAPILIDGINIEWKDIDQWVEANGPPVIINLKAQQKELIRRTRRKAEGDLTAQVSEEQSAKAKELITKNAEWIDQFGSRCTSSTIYQIDFTPQLILAEKLLDDVLKPRVFLVQFNNTTLFQNIAIRYNLGYYDLRITTIDQIGVSVRTGEDRDIIISNYTPSFDGLVCEDFNEIEKKIGTVRYLGVWNNEQTESKDEQLKLEEPPKEEKPKPAEGEEGDAPPPEEEGEPKKKELNIYEHKWTKPGNRKNMSQWFYQWKNNIKKQQNEPMECFKGFSEVLDSLSKDKELCIYQHVTQK